MIKTLEKSGRTEDEAINAALEELGLDRDDVSVEILERAKSGFFGIGATKALVRVSYECKDEPAVYTAVESKAPKTAPCADVKPAAAETTPIAPVEEKTVTKTVPVHETESAVSDESDQFSEIRKFLTGLFERMNISADIEISTRENGGIDVNLTGDGIGAVIGRRGETLDAIQHLTNYVVNRGNEKRMHINIDAEAYRSKREDSLTHLAEKMAEKAIKYKRNMALEPMNSYERHVIHTALQNFKGVTTASTGEEPNRRVVITYVKNEASGNSTEKKPRTREWA